jgi:hypothetical protein
MASCHQSLDASAVPHRCATNGTSGTNHHKVLAGDFAYPKTNPEALADIRDNLTQHSRSYFGLKQDLL